MPRSAATRDSVLARLTALQDMEIAELRTLWRSLFDTDPPGYTKRFMAPRLAYRIQELAYGGLRPDAVRKLERMGEQVDGGKPAVRRIRADSRPVTGTRLIREWKGVEYTVTVRTDGFEWEGRPYRSLSAIARAITGTRWNGHVFFGLKNRSGHE